MELDELIKDCSQKQKKGMHFIVASIVIWALILAVHLTDLTMEQKDIFTFCCSFHHYTSSVAHHRTDVSPLCIGSPDDDDRSRILDMSLYGVQKVVLTQHISAIWEAFKSSWRLFFCTAKKTVRRLRTLSPKRCGLSVRSGTDEQSEAFGFFFKQAPFWRGKEVKKTRKCSIVRQKMRTFARWKRA